MSASVSRDELGGLLAPVRARLAVLARRERWGRTALGVGGWLAVMALVLLVCTLVDNQLDRANPLDGTPFWARMAMRAILIGLAGWLAWFWIIAPALLAPLDENTLATSVEKTNPAFNHGLVTALSYARGTAMPAHEALVRALAEESTNRALRGDWTTALEPGRARRGTAHALLGLAPLLALLAWNTPWMLTLLARQVGFDTPIPRGVSITLVAEGGRLNLPTGEEGSLELQVEPAAHSDTDCQLILAQPDGSRRAIQAAPGEVLIPADWSSGTILARLGSARSANTVELVRLDRPVLEISSVTVHLPDWVGKQADGQPWPGWSRAGDVAGWEGSTVELRLACSQATRQINLEKVDSQGIAQPVAMELSDGGRMGYARLIMGKDDRLWQATAVSDAGLATRFPLRRRLEAWSAQPPDVEILPELMLPDTPEKLLAGQDRARALRQALEEHELDGVPIPLGGRFRIAYRAASRAGIARARLVFRVGDGAWKNLPLPETAASNGMGDFMADFGVFARTTEAQEVPFHAMAETAATASPGRERAGGRFDFRIGPLGNVRAGDRIEYYIEVEDRRSPALVGRSSSRVKDVVVIDDYLGWLARREREQERLRELRTRQTAVFEGLLPGTIPPGK